MEAAQDMETDRLGREFQLSLTEQLFTSLNLSFLTYEIGIIGIPKVDF